MTDKKRKGKDMPDDMTTKRNRIEDALFDEAIAGDMQCIDLQCTMIGESWHDKCTNDDGILPPIPATWTTNVNRYSPATHTGAPAGDKQEEKGKEEKEQEEEEQEQEEQEQEEQWKPPPYLDSRIQPELTDVWTEERTTQQIRQMFLNKRYVINATDADEPLEPEKKDDMKPTQGHSTPVIPFGDTVKKT